MKKRNWAQRSAAILCLILVLGSARGDAQEPAADLPAPGARAAVLIDGASGRLLYGSSEHKQLPMASTTKVMTALLALESCSLQETVTASRRASGVPGTSIYLREGERLTMEEMLLGLMLRSGNDAAVAIAEHVSGSVEAFAQRMNERAQELGAQANFVTPNGLDAGGHSISALGLALVARQAMTLPDFRRIVGTQKATISWPGNDFDRVLTNKNRLLREYEGATGIKTGFTSKAGRCLVFSAEREGMELIGVVLNCGTWFDSAEKLLDWGFAHYSLAEAARTGEVAARAAIRGGEEKSVELRAESDVAAAVCEGDAWRVLLEVDELRAPVRAGQVCGRIALEVNGEVLVQSDLLAAREVARRDFWAALRRVFRRF